MCLPESFSYHPIGLYKSRRFYLDSNFSHFKALKYEQATILFFRQTKELQMINRGMNKDVLHIHNGILFSYKKEQN